MGRNAKVAVAIALAAVAYLPALAVGYALTGHPLPVAALLVGALVGFHLGLVFRDVVVGAAAFAAAAGWMLLVYLATHVSEARWVKGDDSTCDTLEDGWQLLPLEYGPSCTWTGLYVLLAGSAALVGATLAVVLVLRVVIPRRWAA
jgi:hypothetical protein